MQQVGGSVGTAVLSTVVASATTSYLVAHPHGGGAHPAFVAATHGYTVAFLVSASVFVVGAIMGATLFPSKSRLAELRAASFAPSPGARAQRDGRAAPWRSLPVEG